MSATKTDFRILSLLLSFASLTFAYGMNLTLGRVLFTGFFAETTLAQMFNVFAAVSLSMVNRYYAIAIPISVLSYLFPVKYISLIIFLISLTVVTTLPKYTRDVILLIDSIGISYVLFFLFSAKINVLIVPLALIQNVPMVAIPVIFAVGVFYGLKQERVEVKGIKIPKILVILSPLIYLLPLSYLNVFRYPETVDWTFYYQWLQHPNFNGWFFDSRPLYLLILYLFGLFVKDHLAIAQFEFIPLVFLYVFSAYYLSKAVSPSIARLAAIMAVVSPMLLTFLYEGLDANLFSISLMFISIGLLMRGKVGLSLLFSYLSLFSHVYAWAQLDGSIMAYLAILYVLRKGVPEHLFKYVIFTLPPLIIGLSLILSGYFSIPLGDSLDNFYSQILVVGWGSTSGFLYYLLSIYGSKGSPRLIYVIIVASFIAMLFLGVVQNLIIDLPLFLPAAMGVYKLREDLRFPVVLFLFIWALYMILNSFPYMYQGVSV